MHLDSPIVYRNQLQTLDVELTKEDSWVIANLLILPLTLASNVGAFAPMMLSICAGHPVLQRITRVSIVKRVGISNHLQVLSSANADQSSNIMSEGYSCFVSPNGSLFHLRPGHFRYFADAADVLEKFHNKGIPAQKGIARIYKMNHGGGFCSGVWDSLERNIGFLFLNGRLDRVDMEQGGVPIILQIMNFVAERALRKFALSSIYYALCQQSRVNYTGARLNAGSLEESIRHALFDVSDREYDIQIHLKIANRPYLVSHGDIGQIIGRIIGLNHRTRKVEVTIEEQGEYLNILTNLVNGITYRELGNPAHVQLKQKAIEDDAASLNLNLKFHSETEFAMSVEIDEASMDSKIDYSVEP